MSMDMWWMLGLLFAIFVFVVPLPQGFCCLRIEYTLLLSNRVHKYPCLYLTARCVKHFLNPASTIIPIALPHAILLRILSMLSL
jgi:hypothetical protein